MLFLGKFLFGCWENDQEREKGLSAPEKKLAKTDTLYSLFLVARKGRKQSREIELSGI